MFQTVANISCDAPLLCVYFCTFLYLFCSSVPEFIDPVFVKTSPKRSFSVIQNERFGLVFVKTGSIISGTVVQHTITCTREYECLMYGEYLYDRYCIILCWPLISINLTTKAIHAFFSSLHSNIYTAQTTFILVDDIL
jgi:hypothetical protein